MYPASFRRGNWWSWEWSSQTFRRERASPLIAWQMQRYFSTTQTQRSRPQNVCNRGRVSLCFYQCLITLCLGSVAVGRWTCDQEVAGSTPTAALFRQQSWASCSHLMCLCSPSSITWYLARAFMLKAAYCWQRHRVQWTRGYCRAVLWWLSNCIEPRYKSSALLCFT